MKKNILIAVVVIIGGLAAYLYWPQPEPEPVQVQAPPPPPPPPEPEVPEVVEAPPAAPAAPALPALSDSDKFVLDALAGLVGNKSLMKVFHTERIINNFVATIDNLPGRRAPMRVMPVERAQGSFVTAGTESDLTISPMNAERYTPYVKIAAAVDAKKLVELYVRLYPLFQESYEKLGYPKKYFNNRLIVVLDDLLAAPDIKAQIKLVQPNVFYLYADPDLEKRSIGQRILIRVGNKNEAIIKAKLREIKQQLMLHLRDGKVASAG
ncbi:MAG: hypothetical protein A3H31_12225 [Gallionellales bacterium RIFCSPLOWO2_02_FULL_57_47]|nr:MAG: hypothetical protein A3H31_12225 [Gallionellales bacterium RIFCSPLOWO2_02_FULL_57_47]OGT10203.1 MAG: hypothetical protein A3J49_04465 [Gallionellales bacterium RIFCSPHIGHO2_02_FULL_57_16]